MHHDEGHFPIGSEWPGLGLAGPHFMFVDIVYRSNGLRTRKFRKNIPLERRGGFGHRDAQRSRPAVRSRVYLLLGVGREPENARHQGKIHPHRCIQPYAGRFTLGYSAASAIGGLQHSEVTGPVGYKA